VVKGDVHLHSVTSPGPVRFPARSIAEWNPFDLGVHRAITVGGPQTDDQLPDLPGYLRRPHDDELADLLDLGDITFHAHGGPALMMNHPGGVVNGP